MIAFKNGDILNWNNNMEEVNLKNIWIKKGFVKKILFVNQNQNILFLTKSVPFNIC